MSNSIYHDMHSERRGGPRKKVQLKAQLRSNGRQLTVEVVDLSRSGMAVRSSDVVPTDVLVDVSFVLPQKKEAITCEAKILWSDGRGRAGLQFIDLNRSVGTAIETWMTKHILVPA
jgi:hypothetical protein